MDYMKNNERPGLKEMTLKCKRCNFVWSPCGRGGVNSCSNCGQGLIGTLAEAPFSYEEGSAFMFDRVD